MSKGGGGLSRRGFPKAGKAPAFENVKGIYRDDGALWSPLKKG